MMLKIFLTVVTFILTMASANGQGSFNDGVTKGRSAAEKIWKNNGSKCSNAFGFKDKVEKNIKRRHTGETGDWRKDSYNRGVVKGANEVVLKYQKKCLEDDTAECTDLGIAAAQEIAFEYCEIYSFAPSNYDYEQTCRDVAYGICEGEIVNNIRCKEIPKADLEELQKKCEGQVDFMTNG